ncbi:unnamed protein product [Coregonus sp. 'balchen']|nr:unnamed protein product [Coregonus sp. 'balchen']
MALKLEAVETLKTFEKKDSRVKSAAATKLSFLYFLRLGRLEESLDCFLKLQAILRNSAQVMRQLANLDPHRILGLCF